MIHNNYLDCKYHGIVAADNTYTTLKLLCRFYSNPWVILQTSDSSLFDRMGFPPKCPMCYSKNNPPRKEDRTKPSPTIITLSS